MRSNISWYACNCIPDIIIIHEFVFVTKFRKYTYKFVEKCWYYSWELASDWLFLSMIMAVFTNLIRIRSRQEAVVGTNGGFIELIYTLIFQDIVL